MYLNTLSFTNGVIMTFQSELPYSTDKIDYERWNVVIDEGGEGQILSFNPTALVSIVNTKMDKE